VFHDADAFSGFAVGDLAAAKKFYGETLGLEVAEMPPGLQLKLGSGATVFVYPRDNHTPATFTILNFSVDDIDAAVDALAAAGVELERYDGMGADEKGIVRASDRGPSICWFTDPAGNILSVIEMP
jgi:catechol 2,3-dioxygenase-like lactoylglutathione lyase family enzyme